MPPYTPLPERFWAKVRQTPDCWWWTASCRQDGYGQIHIRQGKMMTAHRVAWELTHGPIPNGLSVLHHCDTPRCVRPDHLFLGTVIDNMRDMTAKGRKPRRAGESTSHPSMTNEDARWARVAWQSGAWRVTALARHFNVSHATISRIVHNKGWLDI